MWLRDLTDVGGWIDRIIARIKRLESGAMLENSSISNGRMRFIGGLLLIDSGGTLQVVGTLQVDGVSTVTGQFTVEGPWSLTGDGEITGAVQITGPLTIEGDVTITGAGKLVSGNVRVEGGKIYVGVAGTQIIIDGATGKITAGNMTIDPASGGQVLFPGGATVKGGTGGGVEVVAGSYKATVTSVGATLGKSGLNLSVTDASGFQFVGLPTVTVAASGGLPVGAMYVTTTGLPRRVVA